MYPQIICSDCLFSGQQVQFSSLSSAYLQGVIQNANKTHKTEVTTLLICMQSFSYMLLIYLVYFINVTYLLTYSASRYNLTLYSLFNIYSCTHLHNDNKNTYIHKLLLSVQINDYEMWTTNMMERILRCSAP